MKKVVVIGSGIGGAALAALLQKSGGFDVTVLERNSFIGGKAAAYEKDGFLCDMGVHYCGLGDKGPLKEVANRVGAELDFIIKSPFIRMHDGDMAFSFGTSLLNPMSLVKMALLTRAHPRSTFGALRFFFRVVASAREDKAQVYDETPLRNFLFRYIQDMRLHKLIETFSNMLLVVHAEEASAGEFLYCFGNIARARSLCYPKGAFQAIPLAYKKALERDGGKILFKEPAVAVRVENGRAVGVQTKDGFFPADIVVSNAGIKRTIALAGEDNFPKEYVDRAKKLKNSAGAVTLKYALDKLPYEIPLYHYLAATDDIAKRMRDLEKGIVPDEPHLFIPIPSVSDPGLAPPGKHILIAGNGGIPSDLSYNEAAERLLDNMEKTLCKVFPGFEKHVIWKHRTNLNYISNMAGRDSGEVIGVGQTYYQVGKNRPSPKTPVHGLWLVGTDAGARGVGTEMAAASAIKVSEMIRRSAIL